MSKQMIPSRTLLTAFSRSLNTGAQRSIASQCSARVNGNGQMGRLGGYGRITQTQYSLHNEGARRAFSESRSRCRTVEEQKSRYKSGPFSWKAGLLFLSSGAFLIFYFRYEKSRMERARVAEAAKGVGRPKVGGPFELLDQHGRPFTDADLKGRYSLIYFGFTHCPDICPEELDKMAQMIDLVEEEKPGAMIPVFVTCDPARDTPAVVKEYLEEFHPKLVGLTGTWEQVKNVCKKYRVYFSTPQGVKPGMDYLVDHSIYFYLMDPEGDFVEAIGRQHSPKEAANIILGHVRDWKQPFRKD